MESKASKCIEIFLACAAAVQRSELIRRQSVRDKEFAFQDWFKARLDEAGVLYDAPGRNRYPDFTLVDVAEGYEVKGLAYPGREADFDANSQVPTGFHTGRTVYYAFGRYPAKVEEDEYMEGLSLPCQRCRRECPCLQSPRKTGKRCNRFQILSMFVRSHSQPGGKCWRPSGRLLFRPC